MKVLFVVNNAFAKGNGLSASCRRTVKYLKERGIDVRIMSGNGGGEGTPDYYLKDTKIPIFDGLIRKQGYSFSKNDTDLIKEAISWADVIHLEEPFFLQMETARLAKEAGKALVSTYHLHPENLFASIHLNKTKAINNATMRLWRDTVFNKCDIIQCPTENVKERLIKWKFIPELRVISNGMLPSNKPFKEHQKSEDGTITIVTSGRYSVEKDQITVLKAMKYSHYASNIRLILAGRGPLDKKLNKEADKLYKKGIVKYKPVFGFYSLEELEKIYEKTDLYIHCAMIEVEGMSCMEAIQSGIVPLIAKGDITATSQFALNQKSVFKNRDAKELASKIDYWIEHEEERKEEAKKYYGMGEKYHISKSIDALIQMYEDALKMHR